MFMFWNDSQKVFKEKRYFKNMLFIFFSVKYYMIPVQNSKGPNTLSENKCCIPTLPTRFSFLKTTTITSVVCIFPALCVYHLKNIDVVTYLDF